MRKYYKPRNILRRSSTNKLTEQVSPWYILRSYAEGAVGYLGLDILSTVISLCNDGDIERYLSLVEDLESETQMYSYSLPAGYVFARRQICALLKKYPFQKSLHTRDTRRLSLIHI